MLSSLHESDVQHLDRKEKMEEPTFELKEFIPTLRRWAWLLLLGPLLGAGLSLFINTRINPVYQATAKVLVTRTGQLQSSDFTAYLSDLQLTQTYLQLLTTQNVLDITAERTGVPIEPEDIQARVIRDTQIIEINVEHTDPRKAVLIANTMIDVLVEQNELIQSGRYESIDQSLNSQKTLIESEIQDLQRQIEQTSTKSLEEQKLWFENEISSLQREKISLQQEITELGTARTPEKNLLLSEKTVRLEQVQSLLTLYEENYNNLLLIYGNPSQSNDSATSPQLTMLVSTRALYQQFYVSVLEDLQSMHLARLQNTANLVQIEAAFTLPDPIRPRILLNTILGGMAGFLLAAGLVFLRETLNGTLKTPESVKQLLGVPVMGFVPQMQSKRRNARDVHVVHQPHSAISEAFRSLRTNLEFASAQAQIRTLLVTSPGCAEGKSTVAVNLAAILALSGKSVALLDADMRHPQVHHFFGMTNHNGLSGLFCDSVLVHSAGCIQSNLPNLRIITSGDMPPNPVELLGSKKMDDILAELRKLVDIVVIDAPPFLVADARILAGKVDAVLFVIWLGKTTTERAKASREMFERVGARVIGAVLNRIPHNLSFYYGGDEYFSHYSKSEGDFSGNGAGPEKNMRAKMNQSGQNYSVKT